MQVSNIDSVNEVSASQMSPVSLMSVARLVSLGCADTLILNALPCNFAATYSAESTELHPPNSFDKTQRRRATQKHVVPKSRLEKQQKS